MKFEKFNKHQILILSSCSNKRVTISKSFDNWSTYQGHQSQCFSDVDRFDTFPDLYLIQNRICSS